MDKKLKAGDIVILKSGSPKMTIQNITPCNDGNNSAYCIWFVNNIKYDCRFGIHGLERAKIK